MVLTESRMRVREWLLLSLTLNQPLLALALAQDPSHKSRADRTWLGDTGLVLIELECRFLDSV
jgi:hypothetical protein